jgi:hypothetical protein
MKPRLILVAFGLVALTMLSFSLQAQDQPKSAQGKDEIITSEQQLLRMFGDFQDALLRLKLRLAKGNAEERARAEVLDKVLEECKNLAVQQEFTKMIELIRVAKFTNTGELDILKTQSENISERLSKILNMLQDSKGTRLSEERKTLEKILKDLGKAIQIQQIAEVVTDRAKTDTKELVKIQENATEKRAKVEKDIKDFLDKDKKKDGKSGEAADMQGKIKDGGKGEGAKGEAKDAGKQKASESAKGESKDGGKESKGAKGETKPGQDKGSKPDKSGDGEPKAGAKAGDKAKEGSPDAGAKGDKGDKKDAGASKENKGGDKADKGKEGAPKDSGKAGDPKSDGPKGEAKGGESKKGGDPKEGSPDGKAKAGGDPKSGESGPSPKIVASKESKGGDKGGEGKSGGDAKGGEGKQGEAKSGDSKSGQGQAKDGGAAPASDSAQGPPPSGPKGDGSPPPPPSDPKSSKSNDDVAKSAQKLQEAGYDQKSAEDKIAKEQTQAAVKKQGDAIKKMEDAKKKLEKLLQQMREEEIERVLAALQARCEKMLMMQQQVLAGTKDTDVAISKNPDKKADRDNKLASLKLSDKEKEIVQEANKCIDILEAEGTAVAFPEVFQQLRQDMIHVQKRLEVTDVHGITQGIELDIIDTLKEMIAALKKARDDNQSDPSDGKAGKAGKPADPKLLELIQELKMVRALQKRINDRTIDRAKQFPGQEQARDPAIVRELRNLADRQIRIQEIVRRIANGDNK